MDKRFDGDTSSGTALYTDEAIKEVKDYFRSVRAYLGVDGKFSASINVTTVALTLHNLTGD